MDNKLRILARLENQDAFLKAKIRSGHFQEWQVTALDQLGHPLFGDGTRKFNWSDWDDRKNYLRSLPVILIKQFAIACAEHVLPICTKAFPDDHRPVEAIQAAKDYLAGKITLELLMEKGWAAWEARCAAMAQAAVGAADAARAAWLAGMANWVIGNARASRPADRIAASASEVAKEAAASSAEYEWQREELIKMILSEC